MLPQVAFEELYQQSYSAARNHYGDLGLSLEVFDRRIAAVVKKHLGPAPLEGTVVDFVRRLRLSDLYLATACALPNEIAWRRLERDYRAYIYENARQVSPNSGVADDLARNIIAAIFLPDGSGQSRIGSYDGRCSLATWLRSVIKNQAINDLDQRWNSVERLDSVPDILDQRSLQRLDDGQRAQRYGSMISDAFKSAVDTLTKSDRALLLLRYDQELHARDIAEIDRVHPSTITRRLQQICERLQRHVVSTLAKENRLGGEAIKECLADAFENPAHSILTMIKARLVS